MSNTNTSDEMLHEFHEDAKRWRSMLTYQENEILFLYKLLGSNAFTKTAPDLFKKLATLKEELNTLAKETEKFKKEMESYEDKIKGILECEDISCDTFYTENHKQLKRRFDLFFERFNTYKSQVFNLLGNIL